jgi:hypothetical protein
MNKTDIFDILKNSQTFQSRRRGNETETETDKEVFEEG